MRREAVRLRPAGGLNRFPEPLQAELKTDRKTWRLLAPISYSDLKQGLLTVPADSEVNFAGVPRLPVVSN